MKILSVLLPSCLLASTVQGFAPPSSFGTTVPRSSLQMSGKKKETTWERITGPKLFKTVTNWEGIHSVPLVPLRIMTGLLMIHHGSEGGNLPANFGTPEFQGFVDYIVQPYFGFLPGSPELWSAVHDYAEYVGGILLAVGFLTRPAALSLLVSMMGAVYFHLSAVGAQGFPFGHVSNYSYDFEEPVLYALICLMFWFNGAGPLSIDSIIYKQISQEEEEK
jgi:putative oxidoreductase